MRKPITPLLLLLVLMLSTAIFAVAAVPFVHDDDAEFLTTGDFNGDGRTDVLVLDRATGNGRIGYQSASGEVNWGVPLVTGVRGVSGLAVGDYLGSNRTTIAITSLELNRVQVFDAASTNPIATAFLDGAPSGLLATYREAGAAPTTPDWVCAGADHDPGITIVELFAFLGESLLHRNRSAELPGRVEQGNALTLGTAETLLATMVRGSNDTFIAFSLTNGAGAVLTRSNLAGGSRYAFGNFNGEVLPRVVFYVPGQSNVIVQRVLNVGGAFSWGTATTTTFTSAVERVFVVDEQTNSLVLVRFGDGLVGARLPVGGDTLEVTYRFGSGATGNPAAALPLGNGRMAVLNRAANTLTTTGSEVYQLSGTNYTRTSSNALPSATTYASRANVWLFANEPFVTSPAIFVSSLNAGAWVNSASGLPGSLTVMTEQDRGTASGLGNATSQALSTPPNTAVYALANQYHPAISLFSYASARAAPSSLVTISPPPGEYPDAVTISFSKSNSADTVFYRVGGTGTFQTYSLPFLLSTNAQVQFYGQPSSGDRSLLQVANYSFADNSFAPLVTTNGTGTNNIPEPPNPPGLTSGVPTYAYGTVFYSRRTGTNGAIWSITLDGLNDHFITEGTRPRLSPDGRFLAFLRGGRPFDTIPQDNGSIWLRDLLTGQERLLVARTNLITGFDWEYGNTNLVFDHGCGMFRVDLAGTVTPLPIATSCPEDAPAVSPVDGRLAFHAVAPLTTNHGIYVTDPGVTTKQYLELPLSKPRRPAWSPDGAQLALADYGFTYIPESGMNIFVVKPDGTELHQITGFTAVEGFREGALWTPAADALIGAATISGVNGIWVVPLSEERDHCEAPPYLLPTVPGDDIDFVGTVFVPPAPPRLEIRREGNEVIVSWRRTAWPYVLQASGELGASAVWMEVTPPYAVVSARFEVRFPRDATAAAFFRLRRP